MSPVPPDDAFEVVWLDGTDAPGSDETLPEPAPDRPWVRPVAVVAGLLVLAAVLVNALAHRPPGRPAAASAATGSAAVPGRAHWSRNDQLIPAGGGRSLYVHDGAVIGPYRGHGVTAPRPPALDLPSTGSLLPYVEVHVPCPNKSGCAFLSAATPEVTRAVRAALPGVRDVQAASVAQDSLLVLRAVRARVGGATVEIVAHPANTGDGARSGLLRDGRVRYARAVLDGYTVDVQATGSVSRAALQALAYDTRLRR